MSWVCYFISQNLSQILILVNRLTREFVRVKEGDLFCVRVKRTSPSIWQRRHIAGDVCVPQLLFRVPQSFSDSFVTIQEWELNERSKSQCVRIDFLNSIQLPPSCPFESPAYWSRLRAATLGGLGQISREMQCYHVIETIIPPATAREILTQVGFYSTHPIDTIREAFKPLENHLGNQPRVVVNELMDTSDAVPTAELTADSCVMLQHIRHQRYIRRRFGREAGKF